MKYVEEKYGIDHVAKIGTYGKLDTKAVLKDVARALGYDFVKMNNFTKAMPSSFEGDDEDEVIKLTVSSAVERIPAFKKAVQEDEVLKEVVEISKELQGLNRHSSKHACGLIISPKDKPLANYIALRSNPDGSNITAQGDMNDLERLGFVKMDFLKLRTLTVVKNCQNLIKKNRGIDIDLEAIPLNDGKAMKLLQDGRSVGIFQFESSGMQAMLKSSKPQVFEDLIALNALYRPGALDAEDEKTGMSMAQVYVARKRGEMPVEYIHPILEPILAETYGVIVYQEQAMKIAVDLAGYTMSASDDLRKAIGKKIEEKMRAHRSKFTDGAMAKADNHTATVVFDQIETMGRYSFNKSHSTAYAYLAYISAWLKVYYPVEFMCALLTSVMGNNEKFALYLKEVKLMGIPLLPPDIRESEEDFTVSGDTIRFGLFGIKEVGKTAIQAIKNVRSTNTIKSFLHFYLTVDTRVVNRTVLANLIHCGAFDFLGHTRASLIAGLDLILEANKKIKAKISGNAKRKKPVEDISVFWQPIYEIQIPELPEYSLKEILTEERKLTGLYITADPLELTKHAIIKNTDTTSLQLQEKEDETTVFMGGLVISLTESITKKAKKAMGKAVVMDLDGEFGVTMFPETYQKYKNAMQEGNIVIIRGKTSEYNGRMDIQAVKVDVVDLMVAKEMEKEEEKPSKVVHTALNIMLDATPDDTETLNQIVTIVMSERGKIPVELIFVADGESEGRLPVYCKLSDNLITKLESVEKVLNVWIEK